MNHADKVPIRGGSRQTCLSSTIPKSAAVLVIGHSCNAEPLSRCGQAAYEFCSEESALAQTISTAIRRINLETLSQAQQYLQPVKQELECSPSSASSSYSAASSPDTSWSTATSECSFSLRSWSSSAARRLARCSSPTPCTSLKQLREESPAYSVPRSSASKPTSML